MTDPDQSDTIRNLTFVVDTLADHRGQMRKALNELVRVLEVGSHRQPAGQARHAQAAAHAVGQEEGGGLAGHRVHRAHA